MMYDVLIINAYRFDFSFRTLGWGAGLLLQQQQQRKGTDNR